MASVSETIYLTVILTFLRYIEWTQQTFVSGGSKSQLVPLLERCTRNFKDWEQYRNSDAYIRVWITYVSYRRRYLH
jgi:checkpoint serine/threonine-protein kinase